MTLDEKLVATVDQWCAHDPDPRTRSELIAMLTLGDPELENRFAGPLTFGTAGLRGRMGGGETAMNLATVIRASAGLAAWLKERTQHPHVVVGCDARDMSAEFKQAAAEVFRAAGLKVDVIKGPRPTPVTSFAVRHLGADAGVMITASHNPAKDNGYKVYLGGRIVAGDNEAGVQLIPPADTEIAEHIAAVPFADEVPHDRRDIGRLGPELLDAYVDRALTLVTRAERDLPIVVTPMHGVGGELLVRVLTEAGFTNVTPVAEQFKPNPNFPTVAFPNPEEAGALDLAIATAAKVGARLILALDPDADRCSVAIPDPAATSGWRQLNGDEVGALLGEEAAARADSGVLACSIVSSRLLGKIAKAHGLTFTPTLTGFKWIGRVPGLVFGYEEAIGYCTDPAAVRDKDGITACLRVAELASRVDLAEALHGIYEAYGYYLTAPLTVRMADPADITAAVDRLAAHPPQGLAGAKVTEFADLSAGYQGLPPTPGRLLLTDAGDRIVVRPSGTEPKLKCYLEVIGEAETPARERLAVLKEELAAALGVSG